MNRNYLGPVALVTYLSAWLTYHLLIERAESQTLAQNQAERPLTLGLPLVLCFIASIFVMYAFVTAPWTGRRLLLAGGILTASTAVMALSLLALEFFVFNPIAF